MSKLTKFPGAGFWSTSTKECIVITMLRITVDFIGPWKITVTAQAIEFHAPT